VLLTEESIMNSDNVSDIAKYKALYTFTDVCLVYKTSKMKIDTRIKVVVTKTNFQS